MEPRLNDTFSADSNDSLCLRTEYW